MNASKRTDVHAVSVGFALACERVTIGLNQLYLGGGGHLTPVSLLDLNTVPEIIRYAFVKTLGSVPFLCERFMVIKAKTDIEYQRTVITRQARRLEAESAALLDAGLKGGL